MEYMANTKALAEKFESLAKANEPPPPPQDTPKTPSAKALANKFERLSAGAPAPSPSKGSIVPRQPKCEKGDDAPHEEKLVAPFNSGVNPGPTDPPHAAPRPIATPSAVPVAQVTFVAGAPPRSAPPPPSHGSLVPHAHGTKETTPGSVFPGGQSAAAVAARSRDLDSDDDDTCHREDDRPSSPHTAAHGVYAVSTAQAAPVTPSRLAIPAVFSGGMPQRETATHEVSAAPEMTARRSFGGAPKCPKCDKAVYHAERVVGLGGVDWHKACLRCEKCNRTLHSVAEITDRKGDIFCKVCYAKLFGPKGVGYAGGGTMFHAA